MPVFGPAGVSRSISELKNDGIERLHNGRDCGGMRCGACVLGLGAGPDTDHASGHVLCAGCVGLLVLAEPR